MRNGQTEEEATGAASAAPSEEPREPSGTAEPGTGGSSGGGALEARQSDGSEHAPPDEDAPAEAPGAEADPGAAAESDGSYESEEAADVSEEPGAEIPSDPERVATGESAPEPAEADPAPEPATASEPDREPAAAEPEEAPAEEPEPPELARLRTEADAQRRRAEAAETRLRAVSKAYKDLKEDMEAFRDRMDQQMKARADRRSADLCERLFEPVQNLRRSLDNSAEDAAALSDGLRIVLHQFEEAMRSFGLEEIPGVGADFDPTIHEALAVMPVTDPEQDGRVVQVYNTGYRIGGRVLQAAQVIIGKHGEPAEA